MSKHLRDLLIENGLLFDRYEDAYLIYYRDERGNEARIVAMINGDILRLAYPTNFQPTQDLYEWIAEKNFSKTLVKYGVDTEGFLVLMVDIPYETVDKDMLRRLFNMLVSAFKELSIKASL